jgi:hypothetical protein
LMFRPVIWFWQRSAEAGITQRYQSLKGGIKIRMPIKKRLGFHRLTKLERAEHTADSIPWYPPLPSYSHPPHLFVTNESTDCVWAYAQLLCCFFNGQECCVHSLIIPSFCMKCTTCTKYLDCTACPVNGKQNNCHLFSIDKPIGSLFN